MSNPAVANEIRKQLGGALAMLGAHSLAYDDTSLSFRIRGCKKYQGLVIRLQANDMYEVYFYHLTKVENEVVFNDIAVENLHSLIEDKTGLCTRL